MELVLFCKYKVFLDTWQCNVIDMISIFYFSGGDWGLENINLRLAFLILETLDATLLIALQINQKNNFDDNINTVCSVFRFTSAATANVAENANVGDTVYTAVATDADTTQTVTYTLSASSAVFQLDGSSGKQKIKLSGQQKNKATSFVSYLPFAMKYIKILML